MSAMSSSTSRPQRSREVEIQPWLFSELLLREHKVL